MAVIVDYSTLKAAVADELARADLTGAIPGFIQLAEADLNRQLRVRQMMSTSTGTSAGNTITLPADYREMQGVYVNFGGLRQSLTALTPDALATNANYFGGPPIGYVEQGNTLTLVNGPGNMDYTLTYFATIPSLSDANQQNWLITREPGLYLYASLTHSAPYIQDDERIQVWAAIAKATRDGMKAEDDGARYGSGAMIRTARRNFP
ncbi:phage adaptor protein [Stenotrophomonas sp. AB1(2024)]|uniref:phage adaptor protein n=1 Tax=Stenotrophomonas sp. AB1(2024) TaxID=3132215 RepID=UPI0030A53F85